MGPHSLANLVAARTAALAYYSPYYFLRFLSAVRQQEVFGAGLALQWGQRASNAVLTSALPSAGEVQWLVQPLPWDSDYFGTPVFKLFTGLFGAETTAAQVALAAHDLRQQLATKAPAFYAFGMVPAEDVTLLQGLTAAGWQLVETRLTYYRSQLQEVASYPQSAVRAAQPDDAARIGRIAAAARNPYDRVHADPWFGQARADAYLAHYAEQTVMTDLAATVLVPDEPGLPIDSFLAISDLATDARALNTALSRVLLTAVGPANRGWHVKLVTETLRRAQALGHEAVLMTTHATNHAVFRTCEKLGFRLGATTHVLACHSR